MAWCYKGLEVESILTSTWRFMLWNKCFDGCFFLSIWNLWALDFWGWLWKFVIVGKGWHCLFKNSPALLPRVVNQTSDHWIWGLLTAEGQRDPRLITRWKMEMPLLIALRRFLQFSPPVESERKTVRYRYKLSVQVPCWSWMVMVILADSLHQPTPCRMTSRYTFSFRTAAISQRTGPVIVALGHHRSSWKDSWDLQFLRHIPYYYRWWSTPLSLFHQLLRAVI